MKVFNFTLKLLAVLLVVFSAVYVSFSAQPTVTRADDIVEPLFKTVKHTFTATTGLDTVACLDAGDRAFSTADIRQDSLYFAVHFQTAETTAANSDFDLLWQVTGQSDADADDAFPGETGAGDWVTVETDQNDNSLSWVARFDNANKYRGYKVRALLSEADGTSDAAVAIELSVLYPRK